MCRLSLQVSFMEKEISGMPLSYKTAAIHKEKILLVFSVVLVPFCKQAMFENNLYFPWLSLIQ